MGGVLFRLSINEVAGVVARPDFRILTAGPVMGYGDREPRRAAEGGAGVAPVPDAKSPTPIGRLIPSD